MFRRRPASRRHHAQRAEFRGRGTSWCCGYYGAVLLKACADKETQYSELVRSGHRARTVERRSCPGALAALTSKGARSCAKAFAASMVEPARHVTWRGVPQAVMRRYWPTCVSRIPGSGFARGTDGDEDDKPLVRPTTRKEGRDQAIDDEDFALLVLSRPPETAQRQKRKGAGSNCCTETTGVKGFARARRGDLDFGQKNQKVKHSSATWRIFIWNTPFLHRTVQEEDHSFGFSGKDFMSSFITWWIDAHSALLWSQDLKNLAWADFVQMGRKRLETKPSDFWLFWMEPHHIRQPIHAKVLLQKKLLSFMSGWTCSKWARKWSVQMWLSIILTTCRHSTECTTWREFHMHHGRSEQRRVYDCSRSFSWHSWTQLQRTGPDDSDTDHSYPVDAQGGDSEKYSNNLKW